MKMVLPGSLTKMLVYTAGVAKGARLRISAVAVKGSDGTTGTGEALRTEDCEKAAELAGR